MINMRISRLSFLAPAIVLAALAGCRGESGSVLGKPPGSPGSLGLHWQDSITTVSAVSALKAPMSPVTLRGTMIEKCPVAGCWFMLRDKTGIIKVDTKAAGFVVSEVPLNTEMTVAGMPVTTGERRIAASGLRY